MVGPGREPPESVGQQPGDADPAAARNVRLGLAFFAVYLAVYGAFVLVNAFFPELMERAPLGGVSLAVSWGMGLIFLALALALFYSWLCRDRGARR